MNRYKWVLWTIASIALAFGLTSRAEAAPFKISWEKSDLTGRFEIDVNDMNTYERPTRVSFDVNGVLVFDADFVPSDASVVLQSTSAEFNDPDTTDLLILDWSFSGHPICGPVAVSVNSWQDLLDVACGLITFSRVTLRSGGIVSFNNAIGNFTVVDLAPQPPVADAGSDQSIRGGDVVVLDGSASFDDDTATVDLLYSWSFASRPAGSAASLVGANTATPTFVADVLGTFILELVVTDEAGLSSSPDRVEISTDNLAPTAAAGNDQLVVVNTNVSLYGSSSTDPEGDPLTYDWEISSAPAGSTAALSDANTVTPSFTPDLEGLYEVTLEVSDPIGPGTPDSVEITVTTGKAFAELQILNTADLVGALTSAQVTTDGNQRAFLNFLRQAITAIQENDLPTAIDKLEKAIARTDGCVLGVGPEGNGPGRDWITECAAQIEAYNLLMDALGVL